MGIREHGQVREDILTNRIQYRRGALNLAILKGTRTRQVECRIAGFGRLRGLMENGEIYTVERRARGGSPGASNRRKPELLNGLMDRMGIGAAGANFDSGIYAGRGNARTKAMINGQVQQKIDDSGDACW